MKLKACVFFCISILSLFRWYRHATYMTLPPFSISTRPIVDVPFFINVPIGDTDLYNTWVIQEDETNFLWQFDMDGYTYCSSRIILVSKYLEDYREIILHELLHAGTCGKEVSDNTFWNSDSQNSHFGIYRIARFYRRVFQLNPPLTRFLLHSN